jgi:hypothetical protein
MMKSFSLRRLLMLLPIVLAGRQSFQLFWKKKEKVSGVSRSCCARLLYNPPSCRGDSSSIPERRRTETDEPPPPPPPQSVEIDTHKHNSAGNKYNNKAKRRRESRSQTIRRRAQCENLRDSRALSRDI